MESCVLQKGFYTLLVLVLVSQCGTVPVRSRRQVQDFPLLQEDYDSDDYSDDDHNTPIVDDDTSNLSPLDDTNSDNLQGHIELVDRLHSNTSGSREHGEITSESGTDGVIHQLDIEHGQRHSFVDPVVDHDSQGSHLERETLDTDNMNFQDQGHLPSSRQSDHDQSSVSQGHAAAIGTTKRTTAREHFVINAVGRAVNDVNVNTSEEHETHHGFLMGENINVNTTEQHKAQHGFLMGENVQHVENDHNGLNTDTITARSSPILQQTVTITKEPFITVQLSNISSHELTESSAQEHVHNNNILIDRSEQSSTGSTNVDTDNLEMHEQSNQKENVTTELPLTGDGHVATLPGERNIPGESHENEEHLNEHIETEEHEHGIDVPIDKGEHLHNGNNEEHNEPGHPRHTNNPVMRTPDRNENLPVTEPVLTTPKLIILPTPASLEPEERNTSNAIQEQHSSVGIQGGENEHTEPYPNGQGHQGQPVETGIHGNSGQGNFSEERQITAGEGHIEFVTEVPEIHGEHENKPNKHLPKFTDEKISQTPALVTPSSLEFHSEKRTILQESVATEIYSKSFAVTLSASFSSVSSSEALQTEVTESLQSSTIEIDVFHSDVLSTKPVSPCLQSNYQTYVTPVIPISASGDSLLSSQQVLPSVSSEKLTPMIPVILSVSLHEAPTSEISQATASSASSLITKTEVDLLTGTETISSSIHEKSFPVTEVLNLPTQVIDQFSVSSSRMQYSTEMGHMSNTVTSETASQILATPTSSQVLYSNTDHGRLATSTLSVQIQTTQVVSPPIVTPVTTGTPTTQSAVTFPILTSNPTTKKKNDGSSTTMATTTQTTQKKQHTEKGPDKPGNQSSTASSSMRTLPTSSTIITSLSTSSLVSTTQKVEMSTQPSVYIEIELRMDWNQFCTSMPQFISEIKEIILSKKGYTVDAERFILSTEDCRSANNLLLNNNNMQFITINMYIVGIDGKLDIYLTTETSTVISAGFQQSNYLKDKIVSVHTVNRKHPETLPEARPKAGAEPQSVTMVIVLATMGGVCCVALVILQVLIHRRIKAKRKQRAFIGHRASLQSMDHVALGVIPKSRPNSGYWNPALDDTLELPEPEEHSHILNFSGLANFCMDSKSIYTEFQTIPFDDIDLKSIPIGEEDKNRFANVLPHKHSRVNLLKLQENKSGYINASYVNGYMGEKKVYIATQSPLVNTVDDFWRMIWEQQTRVILMLNPVTQQGKPKQSTCYWPDNTETDCRREFEDYIVTLKKRDVQQDYIDCTLEIMDIERNLKREIHHFWLTCWPDTGPPEPLTFVKFVLDTRPHYENSGAPVVVHCGPGTGRTGTFIAVDMCMRMFEDRRRVDILSCVHKMRCERAGAVQTKEQYNLIYQALNEYAVILSSPSISTRSSVITLHAML